MNEWSFTTVSSVCLRGVDMANFTFTFA